MRHLCLFWFMNLELTNGYHLWCPLMLDAGYGGQAESVLWGSDRVIIGLGVSQMQVVGYPINV